MKHDHITSDHIPLLKVHINKTVRENTTPSVQGFQDHITAHHARKADKVKSDAAKQKHIGAGKALNDHVDKNKEHFENTLKLHKHIQDAKNILVNSIAATPKFEHSVNGEKVKPEGAVAVINNRPTKLNDRLEFNRLNFKN